MSFLGLGVNRSEGSFSSLARLAVRGAVVAVMGLAMQCLLPAQAITLTLQVSDKPAAPYSLKHRKPGPVTDKVTHAALPVGGYRWLIQRDLTPHTVAPSNNSQLNPNTISLQFFKGHHPQVAQGTDETALPPWVSGCDAQASPHAVCLDPSKNYYISILPNTPYSPADQGADCTTTNKAWCGWYSMGGSPLNAGQTAVTVRLAAQPIPTGTISVHVYQDNNPINGEGDFPDESSLPGIDITIDDGISLGLGGVVQDAFGNLLGTQYKQDANGFFSPSGTMVFDDSGAPVPANDPNHPGRVFVKPQVTGDCGYTAATGNQGLNPPAPYLPVGTPGSLNGAGTINTLDACGELTIEYIRPGKYGIIATPDTRTKWVQSSTIEGTHPQEAFVVANGPAYFQEFGPPGYHAEIGLVKATVAKGLGKADGLNLTQAEPAAIAASIKAALGYPTGTPTTTISGRIVNTHLSSPPEEGFFKSPYANTTHPWIGLNPATGTTASGQSFYVAPTADDGTFSIPGVPAGSYALFIFDYQLDFINQTNNFTVDAPAGGAIQGCNGKTVNNVYVPGSCNFGDVTVQDWFHRSLHFVWYDAAGNTDDQASRTCVPSVVSLNACPFPAGQGFTPLDSMTVNLRYRDGSIYQSGITDPTGYDPYDEVFPFFNWLVAEFEPGRLKPTGVTAVVDWGGGTNAADPWSFGGLINPQIQPDGKPYSLYQSTPAADFLTLGFQGFNGNANAFFWGVAPYGRNENGGIHGWVTFDVERAEDDPRYNFAEPMQVGVPKVTVNLYKANVDNRGNQIYNTDGTTTLGPLVATTVSDSWDAKVPTGCTAREKQPYTFAGNNVPDCFDGMRVWNMALPGVFDGGYHFKQCINDGSGNCLPITTPLTADGFAARANMMLPPGQYVVETVMPKDSANSPLYKISKEEAKNADFGEAFTPQTPLAACVGNLHTVPQFLEWYPPNGDGTAGTFGGVESRTQGKLKPLCDRKLVNLTNGASQHHIDFFVYSDVPPAAHATGFILDDFANEFNKPTPTFGEKYSPPFLPVSVRDWTGVEIARSYSDQFGTYDFLVPAGAGANPPTPASYYATVLQLCMNSRLRPDGTQDPHFNPQYGEFCYFWDFYPGRTSYLDTPVVPVSAFAGPDQFPVDCNFPTGTPRIQSVTSSNNGVGGGPYVDPTRSSELTIAAVFTPPPTGTFPPDGANNDWVPNPNYCPGPGVFLDTNACNGSDGRAYYRNDKLIQRDYGFGDTTGKVELRVPATDAGGPTEGSVVCTATIGSLGWTKSSITATLPTSCPTGVYQLVVTRGDTLVSSLTGITVTVGPLGTYTPPPAVPGDLFTPPPYQRKVLTVGNGNSGTATNYAKIQDAIDAANPGDLILVAPGNYREILLLWKPVQLQGWGEGSTNIDAVKSPANKLLIMRTELEGLWTTNTVAANGIVSLCGPGSPNPKFPIPCIDLLPGQAIETGVNETSSVIEPSTLYNEQGADVLVVAKSSGWTQFQGGTVKDSAGLPVNARIDGFAMTGADQGGGVVVNSWGHYVEISNNRIHNNQGFWNGGIRLGLADLLQQDPVTGNETYVRAPNDHVVIRNNTITMNGTLAEGGSGATAAGAVLFCSGADNYRFTANYVCGNFSDSGGGAVGHFGVSNNGRIDHNSIIFNETFFQGATTSAAGISLLGTVPTGTTIPDGTGNVTIDSNLIQGNLAGAGDGGGISVNGANGADMMPANGVGLTSPNTWYAVNIMNNMIVNNMSAIAGAGIALLDATHVVIVNNTIANNFSLGTAGASFAPGSPNTSTAAPAGISSRAHVALAGLRTRTVTGSTNGLDNPQMGNYSNPILFNNILWNNRAYIFDGNPAVTPVVYSLKIDPNHPNGWDLGVIGAAASLSPNNSILTTGGGTFGNVTVAAAADCGLAGSPMFIKGYCNGSRQPDIQAVETIPTAITPTIAFDEGGNSIRVRFGPLSKNQSGYDGNLQENFSQPWSNYHLNAGLNNPAVGAGTSSVACLAVGACFNGSVVYSGTVNGIPWTWGIAIPSAPIPATDIDGNTRQAAVDIGAAQRK